MAKAETGVTRRVFFQGWCHRALCQWKGPERQYKGDAAFDVTCHELDKHGGRAGTLKEEG